MDLRKLVRRWAGAGLLAGLFVQGVPALGADGSVLPPIGSVSTPSRSLLAPSTQPLPPVQSLPAVLPPASAPAPLASLPPLPAFAPVALPATAAPVAPAVPHQPAQAAPLVPPASPPVLSTTPPGDTASKPPVIGAPVPPPPAPAAAPAPGCDGDPFADVPPVAILPRPGWFPIPPSGPGYYTLCNQCNGVLLPGPPKYPYSRISIQFNSFFDIDWRYLDNPNNTEHDFFDCLKRIRFGPDNCLMWSTGGEFRARYTYEANSRLLNSGPFRGQDNNYDLYRLRVYSDLWITENFRVFAEFLSATSPDYHLQPLLIDRDPADFLNLFVDIRTLELADRPVWLRVGRQELLYGSQRLISPLDWANTRRTFQGIKAFWQSKELDIDAFVVNPVVPPGTYAGGNKNGWTAPDTEQTFAGLWATYKFRPGTNIDLYYLMLENDRTLFRAPQGVPGELLFNTIGSRFVGDYNNFLWDFEGMGQFGRFAAQAQSAWAATAGVGYYFKDCCMTPTAWLYYDYASGSDNLARSPAAAGVAGPQAPHTFNQLFPFGHYYFGFADLVGRQNIHDFAAVTTLYPADWMFTQFQVHNFFLDSGKDFLYNAGGAGIRRDNTGTGRAGRVVGTELDFVVNFHIDNHQDVLFSYSYLINGRFVRQTAQQQNNPEGRENAQALYVQYSFRW